MSAPKLLSPDVVRIMGITLTPTFDIKVFIPADVTLDDIISVEAWTDPDCVVAPRTNIMNVYDSTGTLAPYPCKVCDTENGTYADITGKFLSEGRAAGKYILITGLSASTALAGGLGVQPTVPAIYLRLKFTVGGNSIFTAPFMLGQAKDLVALMPPIVLTDKPERIKVTADYTNINFCPFKVWCSRSLVTGGTPVWEDMTTAFLAGDFFLFTQNADITGSNWNVDVKITATRSTADMGFELRSFTATAF